MKRKVKLANIVDRVRGCVKSGRYLDTYHSKLRKSERTISRPEILFVLENGCHEKAKDQYDDLHKEWSYTIRGKTVDKRDLRVVVSFDKESMLIITAIDLGS